MQPEGSKASTRISACTSTHIMLPSSAFTALLAQSLSYQLEMPLFASALHTWQNAAYAAAI